MTKILWPKPALSFRRFTRGAPIAAPQIVVNSDGIDHAEKAEMTFWLESGGAPDRESGRRIPLSVFIVTHFRIQPSGGAMSARRSKTYLFCVVISKNPPGLRSCSQPVHKSGLVGNVRQDLAK